MFDKIINFVVLFTLIIGIGYSPEGSTGIQAKILGERAAIADAQGKGGPGRYRVINKSYEVESSGRIRWIVELEKE